MRRITFAVAAFAASMALIAASSAAPLYFVVKKPPPFAMIVNLQIDMTGWTALTQGATKGGAEVIAPYSGQGYLLVRANDDGLYAAPINAANPSGPIATSAWSLIRSNVLGEADCQISGVTPGAFTCATLETGGSAVVLDMMSGPSGIIIDEAYNLGGQNAGARPTLLPLAYEMRDATFVKATVVPRTRLMVWDGQVGLFLHTQHANIIPKSVTLGGGIGGGMPTGFTDAHFENSKTDPWLRAALPFPAVPACVKGGSGFVQVTICAWRSLLDNQLAMTRQAIFWQDPPDAGAWKPVIGWPKLNGGVSGAPELVALKSGRIAAVVRGNNGHIEQAVYDVGSQKFIGSWKDEGGFAKAGSAISCTAAGEQPVCYIQGGDGRIWFKKLSAASGL